MLGAASAMFARPRQLPISRRLCAAMSEPRKRPKCEGGEEEQEEEAKRARTEKAELTEGEQEEATPRRNQPTLLRHLFERQTGVGPARYEASQATMLRSIGRLRPVHRMCHEASKGAAAAAAAATEQQPPAETPEREHVARLRFNKPGYLVGTSYWSHDRLELWNWALEERNGRAPVHTLVGSSVVRFEWLFSHREAHILALGRHGDVKLVDAHHQVCYSLWSQAEPGMSVSQAFGLHFETPYCVLYGMRDGQLRHFDIRKEPVPSDRLLAARNPDGSPFEIYSLRVNPMRAHEFAVAGCSEEVRVYDRRYCTEPVHTMHMTTYPALRTQRPGSKDGTGEYSYMTNERRQRRWNLQEMAYNYNGTQLAVSCGYDSIYLFDTSMKYPIGSFGSNCLHRSAAEPRVTTSITGSVVYGLEYFGQRSDFLVAMARGHEHTYRDSVESAPSCKRTSLYVWDSYSQKLVRRVPMNDRNWNFAVHPHQPVIATALDQKGIQLWSAV